MSPAAVLAPGTAIALWPELCVCKRTCNVASRCSRPEGSLEILGRPLLKDDTMPFPVLAPSPTPVGATTLNRTRAAARLGVNGAGLDKLIRAGLLSLPLQLSDVDKLTGRDRLTILDGELTVLRMDARVVADDRQHPGDPRRWAGFHVEHSDLELDESSLRWWRADVARVLDNQLLAVTVATFPVALYLITEEVASGRRPDETWERHRFGGDLLARMTPGTVLTYTDAASPHRKLAEQIMTSRIVVDSGGPIGYLEPTT